MDHMEPITEAARRRRASAAPTPGARATRTSSAEGYTFSKEAIIVYTMKRALEVVGDGVRVNCISPGPTATPMMPEFEKAAGAEFDRASSRGR